MNLYLDTGSVLKLFIEETDSVEVERTVDSAALLATSLVTWPETHGGLARAARAGRITEDAYPIAIAELHRFWNDVRRMPLDESLAASAGDLAAGYYLRGLDAIHLASALRLRDFLREPVAFSTFDDRLMDAAAACGLDTA